MLRNLVVIFLLLIVLFLSVFIKFFIEVSGVLSLCDILVIKLDWIFFNFFKKVILFSIKSILFLLFLYEIFFLFIFKNFVLLLMLIFSFFLFIFCWKRNLKSLYIWVYLSKLNLILRFVFKMFFVFLLNMSIFLFILKKIILMFNEFKREVSFFFNMLDLFIFFFKSWYIFEKLRLSYFKFFGFFIFWMLNFLSFFEISEISFFNGWYKIDEIFIVNVIFRKIYIIVNFRVFNKIFFKIVLILLRGIEIFINIDVLWILIFLAVYKK